jgi:hypothetical protein
MVEDGGQTPDHHHKERTMERWIVTTLPSLIIGPFSTEDEAWNYSEAAGLNVEDILPLIPERHRTTPRLTPQA